MTKRNALVIDLDRCIGCKGCSVSCKNEHDVPPGINYCWLYQEGPIGIYPKLSMYFLPRTCMQCSDPECIKVCPTKATAIGDDGVVTVDEDRCFGCQYCIWACPYEARSLHPKKRVVQKCNMCLHLTSQGKDPACVANCPAKARTFGDLNDPASAVSSALARNSYRAFRIRTDLGTEPNVYYLTAKGVRIK